MLVGTHSRRTCIPAPEFARHQNKFQSAGTQTYATHFTPRTSSSIQRKTFLFPDITGHPAFSCLQTSQTRYLDNFLKSITTLLLFPTYTITLCNFVAPTCSVWYVNQFRETGVVHRITYSFNYFFFTWFYLLNLLLIKWTKGVLYQVKQLNHILLK